MQLSWQQPNAGREIVRPDALAIDLGALASTDAAGIFRVLSFPAILNPLDWHTAPADRRVRIVLDRASGRKSYTTMKARFLYSSFAVLLLAGSAAAQGAFTSGSTGADGALNYATPGTYNFDPSNPVLNPAGDNIFNFTTINIATGVTLNLTNALLRGKPVIWLATGNVSIAGNLVLDGASAPNLASFGADWIANRAPTQPGPGGFPGGVGARYGTPATPASPGLGPGGAPVQTSANCTGGGSGSFGTVGNGTPAASTYGTLTRALIGGSGGSGGCYPVTATAADTAAGRRRRRRRNPHREHYADLRYRTN